MVKFLESSKTAVTSEQWQQALQLYNAARELPESGRRPFVESQGAGAEVLREVLEMLDSPTQAGADSPPPPPSGREGLRIGRYEVGGLLGRGGMGEVYAARDIELNRPVALKFLLASAPNDSAALKRCIREAKAASALNHPGILTVFEVIQSESGLAIAMELVEGTALREFRGQALPMEDVTRFGRQIASALAAAHDHGIVHRDIKPENLMLRADGFIKVLDFGLAREVKSETAAETQSTGLPSALGTLRYMSPEQLRAGPLRGSSDIFSLGIVLYELATGSHPFDSGFAWETAHAISTRQPAAPSALNADVTREMDALILAMLAKQPELRPSARQVEKVLAGELPAPRIAPLRSRWPWTAAAAAIVLTAAGWYGSRVLRGGSRETPLTVVPLTAVAGDKDYAAFSPDGGRIAFSWSGGQRRLDLHIYVKPVGAGDPVQLTSAPGYDLWPTWSPDGRTIAFFRRLSGQSAAVYLIPSSGGTERFVAKSGDGVSWSPDGKALLMADLPPPEGSGGIVLLSLDTGQRRTLTGPQPLADSFPLYSPDGQWIAFLRRPEQAEVFVMPARGGTARQLTFDRKPKLGITWTADSRELVYSTLRESGGEGLWRVRINGGEAHRLSGTLPFAGSPNISRRGDRLAYTETYLDTNIYLSEGPGFSAGLPGKFGPPRSIIASSREDHSPNFSPDGERIAFVSNRSGNSEIWTSNRDGTHATQLTSFKSFAGTPRWSPDGRSIAFDLMNGGKFDIWVIDGSSGAPRRITEDRSNDNQPFWSPDGKWIYFNSNRSGSPEIWRMPAEGGPAVRITRQGGREPLVSPDGRMVYYTKTPGGSAIWSVPADGGPEQPVPELERYQNVGRVWGLVKYGIYFVSREDALYETIRFFSFATRQVTSLTTWEAATQWSVPAIALSADGRYLLTVRLDQEVNDLMMIENFR